MIPILKEWSCVRTGMTTVQTKTSRTFSAGSFRQCRFSNPCMNFNNKTTNQSQTLSPERRPEPIQICTKPPGSSNLKQYAPTHHALTAQHFVTSPYVRTARYCLQSPTSAVCYRSRGSVSSAPLRTLSPNGSAGALPSRND